MSSHSPYLDHRTLPGDPFSVFLDAAACHKLHLDSLVVKIFAGDTCRREKKAGVRGWLVYPIGTGTTPRLEEIVAEP